MQMSYRIIQQSQTVAIHADTLATIIIININPILIITAYLQ